MHLPEGHSFTGNMRATEAFRAGGTARGFFRVLGFSLVLGFRIFRIWGFRIQGLWGLGGLGFRVGFGI